MTEFDKACGREQFERHAKRHGLFSEIEARIVGVFHRHNDEYFRKEVKWAFVGWQACAASLRTVFEGMERERNDWKQSYITATETGEEVQRELEAAELERDRMRKALVAAVPFLFEHGHHTHDHCYRGSDDGCYCGLDEAKKVAEEALAPQPAATQPCNHANSTAHPADQDIRRCDDCDALTEDGGETWATQPQEKECQK